MEQFLWELLKQHPPMAVVVVCLVVGLIAQRKGWLVVAMNRRRPIPPIRQDSGRIRALAVLDIVQREKLDMPERWQQFVDDRSHHKAANILQREILPLIQQNKVRVERLEPDVQELKERAEETHDRGIRVEEMLKAVERETLEIKTDVKGLTTVVMRALAKEGNRGDR